MLMLIFSSCEKGVVTPDGFFTLFQPYIDPFVDKNDEHNGLVHAVVLQENTSSSIEPITIELSAIFNEKKKSIPTLSDGLDVGEINLGKYHIPKSEGSSNFYQTRIYQTLDSLLLSELNSEMELRIEEESLFSSEPLEYRITPSSTLNFTKPEYGSGLVHLSKSEDFLFKWTSDTSSDVAITMSYDGLLNSSSDKDLNSGDKLIQFVVPDSGQYLLRKSSLASFPTNSIIEVTFSKGKEHILLLEDNKSIKMVYATLARHFVKITD
jgi:hypothetical protein